MANRSSIWLTADRSDLIFGQLYVIRNFVEISGEAKPSLFEFFFFLNGNIFTAISISFGCDL
tara:strand:- start:154 stop:339 length:186 start_codon:yes stop_codon:yes gene_type:complete